MTDAQTPRDYKDTVFLPKTGFPMKAGLPQKEPGILARWEAEGLYRKLREEREGREKFVLHDGPPYANGDMHIGHALNHVLKDMVVRTQSLLGKDAPYVPGWDCHGLPIEWKVEAQYRKKKLNKDEVPAAEFRAECRAYAQHWVDVQREQLKRLGINGDWDNPYLTMDFAAEATIVSELLKFAEAGNLYRGAKPVMWSPVEKTALAEAEVEYEDIVSTQIDVAFEVDDAHCCLPIELMLERRGRVLAVVWTTTPWTIPVNQAIAFNPDVVYSFLRLGLAPPSQDPADWPRNDIRHRLHEHGYRLDGDAYLVAKDLLDEFVERMNRAVSRIDFSDLTPHPVRLFEDFDFSVSAGTDVSFLGRELKGATARHPMHHLGGFFAEPRPFLPGDFVTTDSGTGLVHMAPDHGEDDFVLCKANGLTPKFVVEADGRYRDDWLWLGGDDERRMSVINPKFNAPDGPICSDLREAGALLSASADYQHSYPHSWRSKAKVIYRCTPQWFVPMDKVLTHISPKDVYERRWEGEGGAINPAEEDLCDAPTLRQAAMEAIEVTRFVPAKGRNRIGSMVAGRPDWVLSRQRAWGVPITLFVDRESGEYLADPAVNTRIVAAVRAQGVDAWSDANAQALLGDKYDAADYERVADILDVWFDSGCTHAFVLESGRWPDLTRPPGYKGPPADLYLEGSDQHRGWFQSSLLESCATRGRAPYKAVLTHGFTMASDGRKMSKSLGNTVDPNKVMEQYGADIIRLWALSVDYTEDHRIGDEILKGAADQYRKLRNTFRYLLGALDGFDYEAEGVEPAEMPELERYVLGQLHALDATLRQAIADFDFNEYTRALVDFANEDLSAFFFDIRKDRLYCDDAGDPRRRAYRTTLDVLFHALVRYAAPVLVFTAEEAWTTRFPERGSVHLQELHPLPVEWADPALAARFDAMRSLRERAMEAIEPLRRDKVVRSGLEAEVAVPADAVPEGFTDADLAELFIVASVARGQGEGVTVTRTTDHKCGRCWRLLPEVAEDGVLCKRCDEVVSRLDAAA